MMQYVEQEDVTAAIVQRLVEKYEGEGEVRSGRTSRLLGSSGYPHQIDVVVDLEDSVVLYECKSWGKPVGPSAVLAFAARVLDIAAVDPEVQVIAAIVTNDHITDGAEKIAAHFGIHLQQVRSAAEFDLAIPRHGDRPGHHHAGLKDGIRLSG